MVGRGRASLLFGSTMKLGRQEETEEHLREIPTENRSRVLQKAKTESWMTLQLNWVVQIESRNLNKYFCANVNYSINLKAKRENNPCRG